jgi:hypothetical protein
MADTQIPNGRNALLDFYEAHAGKWAAGAGDVGLTPELAAAVVSRAAEAAEAREAMIALRTRTKMASVDFNDKIEALRSTGGAAVATIRAFAEATNNSEVYIAAEVSPAADPSPPPPPEAPSHLIAMPNASGTITLKITGSVARNGSFDIERSIDGGAYTLMKHTRAKMWTDEAVPRCAGAITYRVFGVRNDRRSIDAATARVQFGALPAGVQAAFRGAGAQAA